MSKKKLSIKTKVLITLGAIMLIITLWSIIWLINYNIAVKPMINNPNYNLVLGENFSVNQENYYISEDIFILNNDDYVAELYVPTYPRISHPHLYLTDSYYITDEHKLSEEWRIDIYIYPNICTGQLKQMKFRLLSNTYAQDFCLDMDGNLLNEDKLSEEDLAKFEKNKEKMKALLESTKELLEIK